MPVSFLLAALVSPTIISRSVTDRSPDIQFAKWQTFDARLDTVEIWLTARWEHGERLPPYYLMKRTVSYRPELKLKGQAVLWADKANCTQGAMVINGLTKINMPPIYVPEISPEAGFIVRADGAAYRLTVPAQYPDEPGEVTLSFGRETPVAIWIDESFRSLASCWQSKRP